MKFSRWQRAGAKYLSEILSVLLMAIPGLLLADALTIGVTKGKGGEIVLGAGDQRCRVSCEGASGSNKIVSLLAKPNAGYRFNRWFGACEGVLGPLCTVRLTRSDRVSAQFVSARASKSPVKVLLLLHGDDEKPVVWNKFAERYFNQQCPVIYGGVILNLDSINPFNGVHCYRVAFGYYRRSNLTSDTGLPVQALSSGQAVLAEQENEIAAAVLGIKQRHPEISLTLVSAASISQAAQRFIKDTTPKQGEFQALLTLRSPDGRQPINRVGDTQAFNYNLPTSGLPTSPRQAARINTALTQLTGFWWLAK